jgi:hypothetical protein
MSTLRTWLLRVLLKIMWSVGGKEDRIDGLPRLTSVSTTGLLAPLQPGDFVLLGNNGTLTHVAVYVGQGDIVHAMATEKTMRGWLGSIWDALQRLVGSDERLVGVVREPLAAFLDRYERDTLVAVRVPALTDEVRSRGLARVQALVGQPYDYGFRAGNDSWYCTELVQLFLDEVLGTGKAAIPPKRIRVPLLLDEDVIEPEGVLRVPGLHVVLANDAAKVRYAERLAQGEGA